MSEEPTITVETKDGRVRTRIQGVILAILIFLGGYVTLYADRHNDERYISKQEYAKDRQSDKELRAETQSNLTQRLDEQDKKLDDISKDVKSLLFRQPHE